MSNFLTFPLPDDTNIFNRELLSNIRRLAHATPGTCVHTCQPGEFKMREIFDFLFTRKRHMMNTFPDENKCPSYKGACLIEVTSNNNPPLNNGKISAIEKCPSCVMQILKKFYCTRLWWGSIDKRESLEFFNLITWTLTLIHISVKKEKFRECRHKNVMTRKKLMLCNSLSLKHQIEATTQTNLCFKNTKNIYRFFLLIYVLIFFGKSTDSYLILNQN